MWASRFSWDSSIFWSRLSLVLLTKVCSISRRFFSACEIFSSISLTERFAYVHNLIGVNFPSIQPSTEALIYLSTFFSSQQFLLNVFFWNYGARWGCNRWWRRSVDQRFGQYYLIGQTSLRFLFISDFNNWECAFQRISLNNLIQEYEGFKALTHLPVELPF